MHKELRQRLTLLERQQQKSKEEKFAVIEQFEVVRRNKDCCLTEISGIQSDLKSLYFKFIRLNMIVYLQKKECSTGN